jgi:uroporphyrinogen decarboxylase
MTYTSFERLRTALDHKEPDRVPCDFGAAEVAAINIHTMRNLRAHLGLSPDVAMDNKVIQTARMEDDLIERLRVDVKVVAPKPPLNQPLAKELGLQDGYHRLMCEFGMGWQMPQQGGHYYDPQKTIRFLERQIQVEGIHLLS